MLKKCKVPLLKCDDGAKLQLSFDKSYLVGVHKLRLDKNMIFLEHQVSPLVRKEPLFWDIKLSRVNTCIG